MSTLRLAAPAKINPYLEILARRDDGFHELETVFLTLELHDVVTVALRPGSGITLTCSDPSLPDDAGNLAWRAAAAVAELRPALGAIAIALDKRIPHAAGLGGGSSDAAAVLRALQRLMPRPLAAAELAAVAAGLGSDVPFFLIGGAAHALGRGERLTPLPDPPALPVTVVKPPVGCPTPAVYQALTAAERGPRRARGADWWRTALAGDLATLLHNRLAAPAGRVAPAVAELLTTLRRSGHPCLLSGSGSAVFVLGEVAAPAGTQAWSTRLRPRARLDHLD